LDFDTDCAQLATRIFLTRLILTERGGRIKTPEKIDLPIDAKSATALRDPDRGRGPTFLRWPQSGDAAWDRPIKAAAICGANAAARPRRQRWSA
jgi:hypothetical protein